MFESLTDRLTSTFSLLTNRAKLTEDNIQNALRDVRVALLEADVALSVVKDLLERVKYRALGKEVSGSLSPGQMFIKIVNDELTSTIGDSASALDLNVEPPMVILMAGLQGAGKTTSTAKLGHWLKQHSKKSVMVTSVDVYRPAAIRQLKVLAEQAELSFFEPLESQDPFDIAKGALQAAKKQFADILIVDTAGRLHIDSEMMNEIQLLHDVLFPRETLFVVDALTGQDAASTAKSFGEVLPLTGIILTKADGDSRGGAALSVRTVTGKPIKFMAVGETIDSLEVFHAERIASRILGMGDVMTLIEQAEQKIDKKKAKKLAQKISRGKKFDLVDFRDQIQQMNNMGGLSNMLDKVPGMGQVNQATQDKVNDGMFIKMEAIINSMTPRERSYPDSINGSRKKRIAGGSGTQIQDVNRLLKQHKQMQKMMKKLGKKGGVANMMRGMGGMLPPTGFHRR